MPPAADSPRDLFLRALRLVYNYSPHTIAAYRHDIDTLLTFLTAEGYTPLTVPADSLQRYVQYLAQQGHTTTTLARQLAAVHTFFRYLYDTHYRADSPAEHLATPARTQQLPQVLTVEEVDSMLSTLDVSTFQGQRNRTIIEVLFSCGLRVSELVALQKSNWQQATHTLRLLGKGNKERIVPLSGEAEKQLALWEAFRREITIPPAEEDYLFLSAQGKHLTRTMILIMIKKVAHEAGIKKVVSPHTLRHSCATALLKGGADIRYIQQFLGHASINTTQRYTHIDNSMLREEILLHHPRNIRK